MAQLSCKRGTKSKSHTGMKLAPVPVFSCKNRLSKTFGLIAILNIYQSLIAPNLRSYLLG